MTNGAEVNMVITKEETRITEIKAGSLKTGNVFLHNDKEHVAIEDYTGGFALWVTSRKHFILPEEDAAYSYTSSCVIRIGKNDIVTLTGNLLKSGTRKG